MLKRLVPIPHKVAEKDFAVRQAQHSQAKILLELAYCMEMIGVPFDIVPQICRTVFLLTTASHIPNVVPVTGDSGNYHFGESPFSECVGSLTIPYDSTVHIIQQSPFFMVVILIFVYHMHSLEKLGMHHCLVHVQSTVGTSFFEHCDPRFCLINFTH